jgi:hypothetical protein
MVDIAKARNGSGNGDQADGTNAHYDLSSPLQQSAPGTSIARLRPNAVEPLAGQASAVTSAKENIHNVDVPYLA